MTSSTSLPLGGWGVNNNKNKIFLGDFPNSLNIENQGIILRISPPQESTAVR